jgi:hypothetical protein
LDKPLLQQATTGISRLSQVRPAIGTANQSAGCRSILSFSVLSATSDDAFTHPIIHHPFCSHQVAFVLEGNLRRQRHNCGKLSIRPATTQGRKVGSKPLCSAAILQSNLRKRGNVFPGYDQLPNIGCSILNIISLLTFLLRLI